MSFLFGFLGVIIGIIVVIIVIVFIVLKKIQRSLGISGIKSISTLKNFSNDCIIQSSNTPKSVNGMTSLVEPQILSDFPDFNKEIIYALVESNLKTIFSEIENLKTNRIPELELINNTLEKEIEDLRKQKAVIKYDNVVFHRHALKRYEKLNGIATVTTSSTLEYNYYDSRRKENSSYKTQTRYTCKFIYIYDINKIPKKSSHSVFIFNCPNCGAPLTNLEKAECLYCASHIEEINLKTWKMSSYKDDYLNKL